MTTWTAPRTYVQGELITISIGNTHWRDNLLHLKESVTDLDTRLALHEGIPYASIYATVGNVATGEDDLMSFSLGAGVLTPNGMALRVIGWGKTANNANVKTLKGYFAGTAVVTLLPLLSEAGHWLAGFVVQRAASATAQRVVAQAVCGPDGGYLTAGTVKVSQLTANLASAQTVKFTGSGTLDNDITMEGLLATLRGV